jgi:hypothetical protein
MFDRFKSTEMFDVAGRLLAGQGIRRNQLLQATLAPDEASTGVG